MGKRILLLRPFRPLGTGGPVPPLGLLTLAASVRESFGAEAFDISLLDMGHEGLGLEAVRQRVRDCAPDWLGISAMTCEADMIEALAGAAKQARADCRVVVGGPHASMARQGTLSDPSVDFAVIGEGERSFAELLGSPDAPERVQGIAYRKPGGEPALTPPRAPEEDLDRIPFPAWDLVDLPSYARHRTWNGLLERPFYAPLCTSRGCPYSCVFCHDIFGKRVRALSPGKVVAQMRRLVEEHGCREFHIVDDAFNADPERVQRICALIREAGLDVSLSFPNGLRADIATDAVLEALRAAGTYKINFGFETASPRLQKLLRKNVDIPRAAAAFRKSSELGILTGAYFMLGIPTETREEMLETIRFAAESPLDSAAFFKATAYPGTELHASLGRSAPLPDLHFFSESRSLAEATPRELNGMLLLAQRRFFLDLRRFLRGLRKAPSKGAYLLHWLEAMAVLLQAHLAHSLRQSSSRA